MKLIPIRDRIVVRLIEAETKTASGLIIPDAAAEKPSQGDVLAVGIGATRREFRIPCFIISERNDSQS